MKTLLIDPRKDRLAWAVKQAGRITSRGFVLDFEEARSLQKRKRIKEVWIDEGYRTDQVRAACQIFGWNRVKGRFGVKNMANEIEEACHPEKATH